MLQAPDVIDGLKRNYASDIQKRNTTRRDVQVYLDKRANVLSRLVVQNFVKQGCISIPVCRTRWRKYSPKRPMRYATGGYPGNLTNFFVRLFRHFMRVDVQPDAIYWSTQEWIAKHYDGLLFFCKRSHNDRALSTTFRIERATNL